MIKTIYRPKRMKNGKRVTSRLYSLKLRLDGERRISQIALGVSDRQVADEKARKIVQEREKELNGLIAPKLQRDSAQALLTKHIQDFVSDLKIKGRNSQYINEMENRLALLASKCHWHQVKDVTSDSFIHWRAQQAKSPKTLNEYLASVKGLLNWMLAQGRMALNPLVSVQKVEMPDTISMDFKNANPVLVTLRHYICAKRMPTLLHEVPFLSLLSQRPRLVGAFSAARDTK